MKSLNSKPKIDIKPRKHWTMREIALLREKYFDGDTNELAKQLNRPIGDVRSTANKHRLYKAPKNLFIPQAKLLRLFHMIKALSGQWMDVNEIAELLDMSSRGAYRYMAFIRTCGYEVVSEDKKYRLKINTCPCCGHTTNNHYEQQEKAHQAKTKALAYSWQVNHPQPGSEDVSHKSAGRVHTEAKA